LVWAQEVRASGGRLPPLVLIAPPDVPSVENILTPFVQFDDGSTNRDHENKQQDHFNDHNVGPLGYLNNHGLTDTAVNEITRRPFLPISGLTNYTGRKNGPKDSPPDQLIDKRTSGLSVREHRS
jgi:hypothetical protein